MIFNHFVNINGQKLMSFTYGTSGGMRGGYYRKSVERCKNGHACICIESAEGYNQKPETKKFEVDESIMEELEKIIRNNQMNFWNQKKFSNMFICDGESKSYSFCFEKASISFSSQVYPTIYRTKLKKFDEVIDNYLEGAKEKKGLFGKRGK